MLEVSALSFSGPRHAFIELDEELAFGFVRASPLGDESVDPLIVRGQASGLLLGFEGRLDNRDEIAAAGQCDTRDLSDAALLLALFERVGEHCFEVAAGNFIVAIWERDSKELLLYRAPFASRTLFIHRSASFMAFASTPQQLLALDHIPRRPDLDEAARLAAGFGRRMDQTLFAGISGVAQGCAMRFGQALPTTITRPWSPFNVTRRQGKVDDLASELQERFEQAVTAAIHRPSGGVASQLSAGRDSSAVTGIAARLLSFSGDRLTALTAAPAQAFEAEDPLRISDESDLAEEVARLYPNIDHHICRPSGEDFLRTLREHHRLDFGPHGNPTNLPWWNAMNQAAARAGASVMLEGSLGNDTISAGGTPAFGDYVDERGLAALPTLVQMFVRPRGLRRRTIIKQLIGPWLPRSMFILAMRTATGGQAGPSGIDLLREPYRSRAAVWLATDETDERPTASYRQQRGQQLLAYEPADIVTQRLYGLDSRDPTSDRRLVEFCLSLPASVLVAADGGRPLYEKAFGRDLPPAIINCRRRGFQAPNWIEMFPPEVLRSAFRKLHRNPAVEELFDLVAIEARLDRWPTSGGHRLENLNLYRHDVLTALAVADFIDTHFPA